MELSLERQVQHYDENEELDCYLLFVSDRGFYAPNCDVIILQKSCSAATLAWTSSTMLAVAESGKSSTMLCGGRRFWKMLVSSRNDRDLTRKKALFLVATSII